MDVCTNYKSSIFKPLLTSIPMAVESSNIARSGEDPGSLRAMVSKYTGRKTTPYRIRRTAKTTLWPAYGLSAREWLPVNIAKAEDSY